MRSPTSGTLESAAPSNGAGGADTSARQPRPTTLGLANYNLACGYARLGRTEDALTAIERAVGQRFGARNAYETDADLAPLRAEPRFTAALDRLASAR